MSLNFAAISPHPPLIIPEIGKEDLNKTTNTVVAMKKLGSIFNQAEIDVLIVISPHMLTYPDRFNICGLEKLFGTFAQFETPEIIMNGQNDLELASRIKQKCDQENIKCLLYDNESEFFELDHGAMVPLYYLRAQQENAFKIVPIAYSGLDRASHFAFGQIIREVAQSFPGRVGILASGDLSHRLATGKDEEIKLAKDFDQTLIEDLKNNKVQDILYYEDDIVEAAGECGFRSILILLGALDNTNTVPEILSYEGPFGVGYLVANFKLPNA